MVQKRIGGVSSPEFGPLVRSQLRSRKHGFHFCSDRVVPCECGTLADLVRSTSESCSLTTYSPFSVFSCWFHCVRHLSICSSPPEEQHSFSGKNNVFPPAFGRYCEMDDPAGREDITASASIVRCFFTTALS